jgi:hypothetical protein
MGTLPSPVCTVSDAGQTPVVVGTSTIIVNPGDVITIALQNSTGIQSWTVKASTTDSQMASGIAYQAPQQGPFSFSFTAPPFPCRLALDSSCTDGFNDYTQRISLQTGAAGQAVMSVTASPGVDPTGVLDSSAGIQAAFNAAATLGVPVYFPNGAYAINSPVTLPSNLEVHGSPQVTIVSNCPGGALANSTFKTVRPNTTSTTTLAANNVVGSNQISSTASLAKGTIISLTSALSGVIQFFVVSANPSGVGPFTLTLDRPVLRQFVNGDVVSAYATQVSNILWHGHGMTFLGVATAYILITSATNCLIEDVNAKAGQNNDVVFPFIGGSLRCHGKRIRCDGQGAGPPSAVLGFSSAEDCSYEDCAIWNAVNGTQLYKTVDSIRCGYRNVSASGAGTGVSFGTDTAQNVGCIKCYVDVGHFDGCTNGLEVGAYSDGTMLSQVTTNYNTGFGMQFDANMTNTTVQGFQSVGNGTYGATIAQTAGFLTLANGNIEANGLSALNNGGTCIVNVDNVSMVCVTGGASGISSSGGELKLTRCRVKHLTGGGANFSINLTGGTFRATDTTIEVGVTGDVAVQIAGATTVAHFIGGSIVVTDGATGTFGLYSPVSGTYRVGPSLENGAATPILLAGSGRCNRKQTLVANGVTGVAVAYQDIKAGDSVQFTLQTIGGTVGHPKYTITAGTGFTFTSDAADTSTYEWFIP